MGFWTDVHPAVFISIFFVFSIAFNLLNVRRYGEIEYWATTIKVLTIVGLVLTGLLISMGAVAGPLYLGTNAQYQPVLCSENDPSMGPCLPGVGFISISALIGSMV